MPGVTFPFLKWLVIAGYNGEPTLRFGIHREARFTAIGCWPIIFAYGLKPKYWWTKQALADRQASNEALADRQAGV